MPWFIHALLKSHSDSTATTRSWTTAIDHPFSAPKIYNGYQNNYYSFHNHSHQSSQDSLTFGRLSSQHTFMLDVPEVLERVLTFLTLQDRLSMRLVCKQWNAASRRLLLVQTVWQENPVPANQHHVLRGLGGLDSLIYCLSQRDYDDTPNVQVAWNRLKDRVLSGQTACLQFLTVRGPVNIQARITPLLSYMSSLTTLHLNSVSSISYTIAKLLDSCPQLRVLDIHSGSLVRSRRLEVLEAGMLQGPYKLHTLSLRMVCITQDSIETTVASCSALNSLSLIDLIDPLPPILNTDAIPTIFDRQRLVTTIGGSCPNLRHFHCSANHGQRAMVSPMALFTNLSSLGLPAQAICPELVAIIQAYTNVLNSLTIDGVSDNNAELSASLHQYLCSTAARHLKQLDAPQVLLDDRLLNLKLAMPPTTPAAATISPTSVTVPDRIWACRGLIWLNISFGTQEDATRSLAESSRIIFGYLSQVCPRLQHLKIARDAIDCSLDGGFCLLSELEDLRTLEVKTITLATLNLWDFGWMDNEPTVLQRLADKMSLNDSRVQKSFRSRYEWLGCKDSRQVDYQRLELLGLISSSPPSSSFSPSLTSVSASTQNNFPIVSPNQCQRQRPLLNSPRSTSSCRHYSSYSQTHSYGGRVEPTVSSTIRWPQLERIAIRQTNDRRNQTLSIRRFIKKMRPDLSFDP